MKFKKSFTYLELSLAGIAIVVLAMIVGPYILGPSDQTRLETAQTEMEAIQSALTSFELDYGQYPNLECKSPEHLAKRLHDPAGKCYLPPLQEGSFVDFQYEAQGGGKDFVLFATASDRNKTRYQADANGVTKLN